MGFTDRTTDFRDAVQKAPRSRPPNKRRTSRDPHADIPGGKEYVDEAYKILSHITSLTAMLSGLRRAYLNVDSRRSGLSRATTHSLDLSNPDNQSWSSIQQLTNEERDQIDLQARLILSKCSDRVKDMEALEKRRTELLAGKMNPITRWLPSRLRSDDATAASNVVAAHRSSITWYLSRRLAETSQSQKAMQEERIKRELERSKTLGSSAAREATINFDTRPSSASDEQSQSWLGGALAATIGAPSPRTPRMDIPSPPVEETLSVSDDDDELELSQSQILQFEEENASILRGVQDKLEAVQQAESRLLDISALQMELVTHLTRQTELTDQLYDDAITTTSAMEKGNVELREAQRRAKDSRIYILSFLIGASLSLLFLHYY
ncbi:snare protein syntaxin 18/UFE1 [Cylindrobasidium torrendii FP15055 ss-10]|uniref:Snare protein syntaxin 18/UFE1 n=1 Tax=Cylindrobasidium torrendii FP15055 ss-10 TaxID=1314674 RepID=A0A0D7BU02_9AGAR|nr:snare protein syntaxin 18/UFE1 [Cylindrobasidium torrendii FP15055 ss-10]